jgi:hypothetical protein
VDLANALHVLRSDRAAAFLTFDRRLARRASDLGVAPAVKLLAVRRSRCIDRSVTFTLKSESAGP